MGDYLTDRFTAIILNGNYATNRPSCAWKPADQNREVDSSAGAVAHIGAITLLDGITGSVGFNQFGFFKMKLSASSAVAAP
jgi:hypothetical protein